MASDKTILDDVEIPGLTIYEANCSPLPQIEAESITIRASLLKADVSCPICLGYIKKTSVVLECMHRFCAACIEKCLRMGKKECPSCRIHIPSKRSLRPDPAFDDLISSIYGDITKFEEVEQKAIETSNMKKLSDNSYSNSTANVMRIQREKRRSLEKSLSPSSSMSLTWPRRSGDNAGGGGRNSNLSTGKNKRPRKSSQGDEKESQSIKRTKATVTKSPPDEMKLISFVLRRHPQEQLVDKLEREYIRTTSELKIYHLKKFLGLKLNIPEFHGFQIVLINQGRGIVLSEKLTLNTIRNTLLDRDCDEFVLHFRFDDVEVEVEKVSD